MPLRSRLPPRTLDRLAMVVGFLLAGCGALPAAGPTARELISQQADDKQPTFVVVDIDDRVVDTLLAAPRPGFHSLFPQHGPPPEPKIGIGDSVAVTVWEAAAGGLFASAANDQVTPGARSVVLPEQVVGRDGAISVPFAGRVVVAGAAPAAAERAIRTRLAGQAIDPQVVVNVTKSVNDTVTINGEAVGGARVPLSLKGDRLLDLIAAAGGTHAPVYETFVRLSRDGVTATVPMDRLVSDPAENIYARPADVLTVVREPQTFTVFGAAGQNSEINFPSAKLTLAEALAKAGGLQDSRSDPAGVFLFRFEPVSVLTALGVKPGAVTPDGRAEIVYRLDLRAAKAYFAAERFPVENKDIIYVANADLDELQKFFSLIGTLTGPAVSGLVVRSSTQ